MLTREDDMESDKPDEASNLTLRHSSSRSPRSAKMISVRDPGALLWSAHSRHRSHLVAASRLGFVEQRVGPIERRLRWLVGPELGDADGYRRRPQVVDCDLGYLFANALRDLTRLLEICSG